MTDADLGYGDPRGVDALRAALADYLGRVRGVVADPERVVVTSGYSQGLGPRLPRARARAARRRIALEDPSNPEQRADRRARRASSRCRSPVDERRAPRRRARARPAPTPSSSPPPTSTRPASCSSGERRTALLAWLRERDAIAIEDDYDAEYRYDRAAVGALQGLEPDRVVYAGSASKTLAPALRLGWLVVPRGARRAVARREAASPTAARPGSSSTRSPTSSRAASSTATCGACARATARGATRSSRRSPTRCPRRRVEGIAAGLHVDRRAAGRPRRARRSAREAAAGGASRSSTLGDYRIGDAGPPTLLLGYGQLPEPAIRPGVASSPRRCGPRRRAGRNWFGLRPLDWSFPANQWRVRCRHALHRRPRPEPAASSPSRSSPACRSRRSASACSSTPAT